ncbi:polymerase delta-interacting protein 3 [Saguinus oedipus]|uniref:Polymerase delta-interacting protein 3 n=1 Tax=Saguinus oedipus TaxID=9490 RepID=A0ABQ9V1T9_SAGOE|nr:polymerase delta-interacting protein 3 [Saguinus oedipus]
MVDISLDELIRNQSASTATFQQRFDAQQKIGLADAWLKLGVKDAQEKLLQKDAQFRIKGKVQDTREMPNSCKQQTVVPQKPGQVADAQEIP